MTERQSKAYWQEVYFTSGLMVAWLLGAGFSAIGSPWWTYILMAVFAVAMGAYRSSRALHA